MHIWAKKNTVVVYANSPGHERYFRFAVGRNVRPDLIDL